ncbi:MAG TPA: four helix bundle protein [Verrucomicrobiae bacterium]|nr:four helix bundle protein [Verrucomicrobiae bacterium]
MKSRSSKLQVSSSKEIPISKFQNGLYPDLQASQAFILNDDETSKPPFSLEERLALFGESIVRFCKRIPRGPENDRLISQLVGAGTSVGANYCEANESVSKKDFRCSISRCKKEVKEAKFFLRMIVASEPRLSDDARKLYREATELQRILAAMYNK